MSVTVVAPYFVLSEIHRRALGPDGRPLGKSPMQEDKIMTAEELARLTVAAMEKRQRLLLTNWRGRPGGGGVFSPYVEAKFTPEERAAKQAEWNADRDKHWSVDAAAGELVSDGHGVHLATEKAYGEPWV